MAVKPSKVDLNATSVDILNTVRTELGAPYSNMVPYANGTTESIRSVGDAIMSYEATQNAFLSALINRIAKVVITSKNFYNPWSFMKQGLLEMGETVEELFVNLVPINQFDPAIAESELYKRVIPDVRSAFHPMNYQKFYKITVSNDQLRQAFLSWQGITDLISKIIESIYKSANYDEFLVMKYLLAKKALAGNLYSVHVDALSADTASDLVRTIKGISTDMAYPKTKYNEAGVTTNTERFDQFIITSAESNAYIDVDVLAAAFNMDKVEFMGHRVEVDSFSEFPEDRMAEIFANDPNYTPFTPTEINALNNVLALVIDRNFMQIYDNFYNMTEKYNSQGLYWNYFYHVWKTYSTSPFSNAVVFTTDTPAITSVSVAPSAVTVNKGQTAQLTATVVTTGLAPKTVTWSMTTTTDNSYVDQNGLVHVGSDETLTSLTVRATSTYDDTKYSDSTITVPSA